MLGYCFGDNCEVFTQGGEEKEEEECVCVCVCVCGGKCGEIAHNPGVWSSRGAAGRSKHVRCNCFHVHSTLNNSTAVKIQSDISHKSFEESCSLQTKCRAELLSVGQ